MGHYLVTGVAGFIGSAMAKRLINDGHQVTGIDNLSTGFLDAIPNDVTFIEAGAHEPSTYDSLYNMSFDGIIHIAGQSAGEISFEDPVYDLQSNTQSTLLLLQLARKTGCKKVLYASTVSLYGNQTGDQTLINEEAKTFPLSFYGVGKLASENYLRIYSNEYNIDTGALRLFNVYGPGQNLKNLKQGMVSIYLAQAIANRHIHIKGSADRFRDFVYIDDVIQSFCTLLYNSFTGYKAYNVCTGVKTTVGDLVESIEKLLPFDVTTEFSGSTPGDSFGYTGDPSLIMNETGWEPKTSFHQGLELMIKWSLSNT